MRQLSSGAVTCEAAASWSWTVMEASYTPPCTPPYITPYITPFIRLYYTLYHTLNSTLYYTLHSSTLEQECDSEPSCCEQVTGS